jgi:hypothetical protein
MQKKTSAAHAHSIRHQIAYSIALMFLASMQVVDNSYWCLKRSNESPGPRLLKATSVAVPDDGENLAASTVKNANRRDTRKSLWQEPLFPPCVPR